MVPSNGCECAPVAFARAGCRKPPSEALERTFSDYQLGKIYQEATVHRHPRNLKKELTPPIEGLAVVLGMFSPRYKEDDIRERIKKHLTSLRVGPKEGEIEISVSDYVVEFLPFGMMGGQMQVTIIPLSIETRKTK